MATATHHTFNTTTENQQKTLAECVREAMDRYFAQLNGEPPPNLYKTAQKEVEAPLLESVMIYTKGNQSKAARILGLSRGTLRTKLRKYFDKRKPGKGSADDTKTTIETASPDFSTTTAEGQDKTMAACVREAMDRYFALLDGEPPFNLHNMLQEEIEAPLLESVMIYAKGNQSKAARILGLSRGTLRTKLRKYFDNRKPGKAGSN